MRKIRLVFVLCLLQLGVSQIVRAQCLNLNDGWGFANKCLNKTSYSGVKKYVDSDRCFRQDVKGKVREPVLSCIQYRIDDSKNWSIDATVGRLDEYTYGKLPFVGLVFGFEDGDNYSYVCSDGNAYVILVVKNGLITHRKCGEYGYEMTRKKFFARIKVLKQDCRIFFALDGNIVDTIKAYGISGDEHGLLTSGKGCFAIKRLKIDNDVEIMDSAFIENADSDTVQSATAAKRGDMKIVGSGTGFLIDRRGYLATNYHLIKGAGAIEVCLRIGGEWKTYDGVVVKDDPANDLAIIKIDDPGFDSLPYAFSFETEDIASDIFTLGYPQVRVMGSEVKYATGVINARTGIQDDPTHYQISAHIDYGNSGGPLFNEKGYIIGITDCGLNKAVYGDVNYAIKSTYLKVLADALPKKLEFANDKSIALKKRTEQIKTLSQYVALILIAK